MSRAGSHRCAGRGNASVTVEFDVRDEPGETLLPLVGDWIPGPAGQLLKPPFAFGLESAFSAEAAYILDPLTQPVAVDGVRRGNAGVTVAFDVVQQLAEAFLPLVSTGVPCPAGQGQESALPVEVKCAIGVQCALVDDPHTEPIAIDGVRRGNASVAMLCDESLQQPEPELPGRGGLFDKAHIESAGEIAADPCGQVEVDLAGAVRLSCPRDPAVASVHRVLRQVRRRVIAAP